MSWRSGSLVMFSGLLVTPEAIRSRRRRRHRTWCCQSLQLDHAWLSILSDNVFHRLLALGSLCHSWAFLRASLSAFLGLSHYLCNLYRYFSYTVIIFKSCNLAIYLEYFVSVVLWVISIFHQHFIQFVFRWVLFMHAKQASLQIEISYFSYPAFTHWKKFELVPAFKVDTLHAMPRHFAIGRSWNKSTL